MNRYVIREVIPYEGWHQWTVFALSREHAETLIKLLGQNYSGESLTFISERPAKGRKEEGIHKHTSKFEL